MTILNTTKKRALFALAVILFIASASTYPIIGIAGVFKLLVLFIFVCLLFLLMKLILDWIEGA